MDSKLQLIELKEKGWPCLICQRICGCEECLQHYGIKEKKPSAPILPPKEPPAPRKVDKPKDTLLLKRPYEVIDGFVIFEDSGKIIRNYRF